MSSARAHETRSRSGVAIDLCGGVVSSYRSCNLLVVLVSSAEDSESKNQSPKTQVDFGL